MLAGDGPASGAIRAARDPGLGHRLKPVEILTGIRIRLRLELRPVETPTGPWSGIGTGTLLRPELGPVETPAGDLVCRIRTGTVLRSELGPVETPTGPWSGIRTGTLLRPVLGLGRRYRTATVGQTCIVARFRPGSVGSMVD